MLAVRLGGVPFVDFSAAAETKILGSGFKQRFPMHCIWEKESIDRYEHKNSKKQTNTFLLLFCNLKNPKSDLVVCFFFE